MVVQKTKATTIGFLEKLKMVEVIIFILIRSFLKVKFQNLFSF